MYINVSNIKSKELEDWRKEKYQTNYEENFFNNNCEKCPNNKLNKNCLCIIGTPKVICYG